MGRQRPYAIKNAGAWRDRSGSCTPAFPLLLPVPKRFRLVFAICLICGLSTSIAASAHAAAMGAVPRRAVSTRPASPSGARRPKGGAVVRASRLAAAQSNAAKVKRAVPRANNRKASNRVDAQRDENGTRARDLWKAMLWAEAAALCLAGVAAWFAERAQSGSGGGRRATGGRRWLRLRGRRSDSDEDGENGVSSAGWASETLSHSLRAEQTRAALPSLWPLALGSARWALLSVFVTPAVALWASSLPVLRATHQANVLAIAFGLAGMLGALALLLARWRARNLGTFALLLCSGISVATTLLSLAHDTLSRDASRFLGRDDTPWLSRSLLSQGVGSGLTNGVAHPWGGAYLGAIDAGYLVGAALVCATALVMSHQMEKRDLFDRPPLEIRHVHPLSLPLPPDTRARLQWMLFCVPVAVALAAREVANAPEVAGLLALAASLCLGGWRFKVMRAREFASAVAYALLAAFAVWLVWTATGGSIVNGAVSREAGGTASRRDGARHQVAPVLMRGSAPLAGGEIPGATGTGTIGKIVKRTPLVIEASAAFKRLPALPRLWARRGAQRAAFLCGALVFLALVLLLLKRPPAHLWSVLALAPAWGWMMLGGASAIVAAPLLLAQGQSVACGLGLALLPAFLFVWLERA